jgi:hypothetical protein
MRDFTACVRSVPSTTSLLDGAVPATLRRPNRTKGQATIAIAARRLLHDLLPLVDDNLKAIRAVPGKRDQDAVRAMLQARESASRTAARQLRWLVYAISLLLVGCLVYFGFQLAARAKALRRRAAFEHAIAGISMRLINAQPQNIFGRNRQSALDLAE